MELLGARGESDTIEFTTTEMLGGAGGAPGAGCAGPEDDGGPESATPPVAVEGGGSAPEAAAGGGGGVLPLTAGAPAFAPAPTPGGGQLKADAPAAPAVPPLSADPTGAAHELPELSPDGLTAGPPPEGAVLVGDGTVVDEDDEDGEDGEDWEDGAGKGEDGAVPASGPVLAEQSLDPAAVPPAVESPGAA